MTGVSVVCAFINIGFTGIPRKPRVRTVAGMVAYPINAGTSVLAIMIDAVIDVGFTIIPFVTRRAIAGITINVIGAAAKVLTRIG